jgi:hypothetical protein
MAQYRRGPLRTEVIGGFGGDWVVVWSCDRCGRGGEVPGANRLRVESDLARMHTRLNQSGACGD